MKGVFVNSKTKAKDKNKRCGKGMMSLCGSWFYTPNVPLSFLMIGHFLYQEQHR